MPAELVFSLVDVISIITFLGCIAFGLFRRDLLMFVACLGLIALTRSGHYGISNVNSSPPLIHVQPTSSEQFSYGWFAAHALNGLAYIETLVKADLNKSVYIGMFIMIMFASLFEGTATNHNFQAHDAYSLPTTRRKFIKTRFFVGFTIAYMLFSVSIATVLINNWHGSVLAILPPQNAAMIQSWLIPASERLLAVTNSAYFRELVLLMALICYDQDANTSISMATIIAFIPTLGLSLLKQALSIVEHDVVSLPSYLVIDNATFSFANNISLLIAHAIMYLAWIKTLRSWSAEQDLFKMRFNVLAEKYNRDMALATASASTSPQAPAADHNAIANTQQSAKTSNAPDLQRDKSNVDRSRSESHQPHQATLTNTWRTRKLSADRQAPIPKLGQIEARKSVQNLVSGNMISLDSRGQSVDSSSMVSVYQQKIGTPTIIPIDDGTECFSFVGKTVLLWDLQARRVKQSFAGHSQPVSKIISINVSEEDFGIGARVLEGKTNMPRSNLLITSSWDGTIKFWEIASAKCLATIEAKMGGITAISVYDNNTKLIAGSSQGIIKLWDLKNQTTIGDAFELSPATISAVGVWSDQSQFFASSFDGCVYIWNLATKRCEKILKRHTKRILDAVLYDSDTRLITASEDRLVIIWDLENGTVLRVLEGHSSAVQVVAVYGDSQRAISGSTDGQLIAWDIFTEDIAQSIVSSLDDHTAAIISIRVFEDDLNKMYTHSMDRKLRIWDMAANVCEQTIDMPPSNEQDYQRPEPETPLHILIAWDPLDGLALGSTLQFLQCQGYNPTVCKSSDELLSALTVLPGNATLKSEATFPHYHIVLLDLSLPGLPKMDTRSVLSRINAANSKLVLLTSAETHHDQFITAIADVLKTSTGFMELTEKPLSELSLAKILHEIAGNEDASRQNTDSDPQNQQSLSQQPKQKKQKLPSNRQNGTSGDFLVNSDVPKNSKASPTATPEPKDDHQSSKELVPISGERRSSLPGYTTTESQLQNMTERLAYVETLFTCFVPVQFFEMISPKGRDRTQLGDAVCKTVTVLFSDIRDFSTMSESMAVSELMEFLNAYLAFAMPPIHENGGFVDKFIGDSIMALFSQDGTQQCISAVACAVSMMSHLDGLQDNGFMQVNTGIGINTGRMIIGLVGVETRMEPTVLGDAVNLASRLESLCKVYDSRVIISEYTREKLGRSAEIYNMRELDKVAVKGKRLACRIYEILEAERKDTQRLKRMILKDGLWDRALHAFRKGDIQQALNLFNQCLTIYPQDKPSKLYIGRCQEALAKGVDTQSWDSIHRLVTK